MLGRQMAISAMGENFKNKRAGALGEHKGFSELSVPMKSKNIKGGTK